MAVGRGVMAVWNDLAPGHEAEFDAWYQRQHVPERLRVPGFREARRYVAEQGSPRYCAFYWLDAVEVLTSPAYLERLAHPTRWTRQMMPWFRAMGRSPCTVTLDRGRGMGGAMTWIAAIDRKAAPRVPRTPIEAAFDRCARDPAAVRLQLWECDRTIAGLANPEQGLRTNSDQVADWIVCIEGTTEASVQEQRREILAALRRDDPQANLASAPVYRLTWSLGADAAVLPCTDEDAGIAGGC